MLLMNSLLLIKLIPWLLEEAEKKLKKMMKLRNLSKLLVMVFQQSSLDKPLLILTTVASPLLVLNLFSLVETSLVIMYTLYLTLKVSLKAIIHS